MVIREELGKKGGNRIMKTLAKTTLVMMLVLFFTAFASAQETLWNELNAKLVTLYQQGQYSEAAKIAEEALSVAEKTFGPDHTSVATSLYNLATLCGAQSKYVEAEPLHKRALAIYENALRPDHPDVATVLENMAQFYEKIGKKDEARRFEEQAKKIRLKNQ